MPKASQRLPLLQTLNSLQLIDALNSKSDPDIQEDIVLLEMITSQRYINPCRRYPSHYMYTTNDLQKLSSEKFQKLCRTMHESFEKLVSQIQADTTFQDSFQNKQCNPAIQLVVALLRLGSNGNGATLGKIGILFGISYGANVWYTQKSDPHINEAEVQSDYVVNNRTTKRDVSSNESRQLPWVHWVY
ncbi:hypothetical protein O181_100305 [Austropuccinia psidii MF-1]|uniref:Uncharacterized protein n=1 Tax=Austropuccinia psidii MF-1 TaxID=1389203 RepID=A0A9Q3JFD7_9BASI|nr:hypothetical protein [Austropuccinia psidii MF-1]